MKPAVIRHTKTYYRSCVYILEPLARMANRELDQNVLRTSLLPLPYPFTPRYYVGCVPVRLCELLIPFEQQVRLPWPVPFVVSRLLGEHRAAGLF